MKICLLAQLNSVHTIRWANALAKHGLEIVVVSPSDIPPSGTLADGIMVCSLKIPGDHFYFRPPVCKVLHYWWRIRSLLRELCADVVHMHFIASAFTNLFFWNGLPNLVITVWGSDIVANPDDLATRRALYKRTILQKAKALTATTRFLADQTARYLPSGWPIEVIPFGIDLKMFCPDTSLRCERNVVRLGFCKYLERKYAPLTLIRAFAKVVRFYSEAELVLCGKGSLESEARKLAEELGVNEKVRFEGWIPYHEMPAMLNTFDIFVMPSVFESEVFGVAAVEAQACGLPVVASDLPGIREAVSYETAVLVSPNDEDALARTLLELLQSPEKRAVMGAAGVKYAQQHFDIRVGVRRFVEIYESVIASQSGNL